MDTDKKLLVPKAGPICWNVNQCSFTIVFRFILQYYIIYSDTELGQWN